MSATHAIGAYRRNQVQHASPVELIVLLYDKAILLLRSAVARLRAGDIKAKCGAVCWAVDIVAELQAVLDKDRGGEIAIRLDALYAYMIERLTVANSRNDPAILEEIARLLEELRAGWKGLAGPVVPQGGARPGAGRSPAVGAER
ncbi:flagellar export chaperone FliS [Nitrospira sp. Kam-Ns4a]